MAGRVKIRSKSANPSKPAKSSGGGKKSDRFTGIIFKPGQSLEDFDAALAGLITGFHNASYEIQMAAAHAMANELRLHFMAGVPPALSPLSRLLAGENFRPLHGLAAHVIVDPPKKKQKRHPKGKVVAGKKVGGQFTSGAAWTDPPVVRFSKGWDEKAWMHEHGFFISITKAQRDSLFQRAREIDPSWKPDLPSGNLWEVKARPFLDDWLEKGRSILPDIAERVFFGKPLPERWTKPTQLHADEGADDMEEDFDALGMADHYYNMDQVTADPNSMYGFLGEWD